MTSKPPDRKTAFIVPKEELEWRDEKGRLLDLGTGKPIEEKK